ncbi:MAG: ABC transporter ATP-binding protein [Christensenellaceae bacterium]|jgi:putative ABC transport system ATP-binding protein|nr:ABC transporter ATP-binding protein [Christensenellaceae bacterium]
MTQINNENNQHLLAVKGLTKTFGTGFGEVIALNNITFSVSKGEFITITGKSGSGKSTLLYLLAGLDSPNSGSVLLNNVDLFTLKGDRLAEFRRRQIGLIYQFYNLIPVLTVKENIILPVRLDHKKVDETKLNELLCLLNLTDRINHLPNQLSGGEQQRTAIGRALFLEPSIILADEPTGNLDITNSNEIIDHFVKLNKEFNQTILLITHDEQIANRANRIITLSDGEIIQDQAK